MPTRAQNLTLEGSPPCSPQIPVRSPGRKREQVRVYACIRNPPKPSLATLQMLNGTTFLYRHLNQLAYTVLVKHLERIDFQNLLLEVSRQEGSDIVAAVTTGSPKNFVRMGCPTNVICVRSLVPNENFGASRTQCQTCLNIAEAQPKMATTLLLKYCALPP